MPLMSNSGVPPVHLCRHDIRPLENELTPYGQRSPQWRYRVQAGHHALDIRGILYPQHGR